MLIKVDKKKKLFTKKKLLSLPKKVDKKLMYKPKKKKENHLP